MVELLAPAGSWEALVAAVQAGADAVYLGGKTFGARQYAQNFDNDELVRAVKYAHLHRVNIFVTVNTLVDNSEFDQLREYLLYLYDIGVDAIIVQDLGVLKAARETVPYLAVHASTQMTVMNSEGVQLLADEGVTRVVLAREVSIENIKKICSASSTEIEIFIHGALCVCYSGQCLMSSLIGGRSGNRGRCAQPCRLPYTLVNEKGENLLDGADAGEFLLSPRDLKTIELIPQLIEAGVHSFKIEGRMKRPEYVAVVVDAYRKAIDSYYAGQFQVNKEVDRDLAQIFNRDFTTAYLVNKQGRYMMSDRRPNNRGVRLGRVVNYNGIKKTVTIKLDDELAIEDGIEFWVKVGGRVGVTVSQMTVNGQTVSYAKKGEEVTIPLTSPVRVNDRVFKTMSAPLIKRAQAFFTDKEHGQIQVDAFVEAKLGQPLMVKFTDSQGNAGYGQTDFLTVSALKRPITYETIYKQITRLGNTYFTLNKLECLLDDNVMVPISEINEARRVAIEKLEQERLKRYCTAEQHCQQGRSERPDLSVPDSYLRPVKSLLCVNTDEVAKIEAAFKGGADIAIFGGENLRHRPITYDDYKQALALARRNEKKIFFSLPRITHEHELEWIYKTMEVFDELQPDAVCVGNLGTLRVAGRYNLPVHADYPLNVYNDYAIKYLSHFGIRSITLSPELNISQINNIVASANVHLECIIHGWLTMMISEYCVIGSFLGNLHTGACSGRCRKGTFFLKDRMSERFPIATDQFCRMHVLNAKELSMMAQLDKLMKIGLYSLRIEAKMYEPSQILKLTNIYRKLMDHRLEVSDISDHENADYTRGHYFRGIL